MGNRTWTDQQLRAVVPEATSWRGVLRRLGLKATSAGSMRTVQRRVAELGIDTDHFKRNRKWSDHQLRAAVAIARSWREVAETLGLTWRARFRLDSPVTPCDSG
jgi:hypothetical protein